MSFFTVYNTHSSIRIQTDSTTEEVWLCCSNPIIKSIFDFRVTTDDVTRRRTLLGMKQTVILRSIWWKQKSVAHIPAKCFKLFDCFCNAWATIIILENKLVMYFGIFWTFLRQGFVQYEDVACSIDCLTRLQLYTVNYTFLILLDPRTRFARPVTKL